MKLRSIRFVPGAGALRRALTAALAGCALVMSAGPASANGGETKPADLVNPDYVTGRKAIGMKNWKVAIVQFDKVVKRDPTNADAHNWLGFAYRNDNQLELSFTHYREALRLQPDHRGAHEYIGQAFLKVDQPDKAQEHLSVLEKLCGRDCEEYRDLAKALLQYKKAKGG
jgi:Tfp pilus assembly protein PilF